MPRSNSRLIIVGLMMALLSFNSHALFPETVDQQRRDYLDARKAIKAGSFAKFKRLSENLNDYSLYSYLQYEYLSRVMSAVPKETLKAFIADNQHTPLAEKLRGKWLRHLVKRGDWKTFMDNYRNVGDDKQLACYRLQHLLKTSAEKAPLMQEIESLWLTGRRVSSTCDPVFKAWRKAGHMTSDLVWARIKLTMERRNLSLAGYLARYLPAKDRVWVERWKAMHRRPARELARFKYPVDSPVARMVVRHGVARLGRREPEAAMAKWKRLKDKYIFFGEDENYVLRHVGLYAARQHHPDATRWLSAVSVNSDDEELQTWRVNAALRNEEWSTAKQFLASMPAEEQGTSHWRYWQARTLEQTGEAAPANQLYKQLAQERGYYGFIAADKLQREYAMQHQSIEVTAEELSTMLAWPGIRAAQELYEIGHIVEARRQWNWVLKQMTNRDLQVGAVIARQWGWHDRAIYTVNKSDHLDDLDLRFPVVYRDMVQENSERTGIDPGWMYGVIRQESAFIADVRSPAGALGLMQLMPRTGRQTGRKLKLKLRGNAGILKVENNILLGASYLRNVLDRNDGNQALATASYNAGPHRVKRWLPPDEELPADIWIDTIPFNETRNYVKNVFAYTLIYDKRLGGDAMSLRDRMPPVLPLSTR